MRFWNIDRFRQMCILSGCDYLASPPGIGIKKAMHLLQRTDVYELIKLWNTWGKTVKAPPGLLPDYMDQFKLADTVFRYQRVFDMDLRTMVTLTPLNGFTLSENVSEYIGPLLDDEIAAGVACGDLNPLDKKPIADHNSNLSSKLCSSSKLPIKDLKKSTNGSHLQKFRLSIPPSKSLAENQRHPKLLYTDKRRKIACDKENIKPQSDCILITSSPIAAQPMVISVKRDDKVFVSKQRTTSTISKFFAPRVKSLR